MCTRVERDRHDSCRVSCRLTWLSPWLGTSFPIAFHVNLEFRKLGSARRRNYNGLGSLGRETQRVFSRGAMRAPFSSTKSRFLRSTVSSYRSLDGTIGKNFYCARLTACFCPSKWPIPASGGVLPRVSQDAALSQDLVLIARLANRNLNRIENTANERCKAALLFLP